MRVYRTGDRLDFKSIVMLGMFDGVHLGHMSLIHKAAELKEITGLDVVMYTFDRNPKSDKKKLISDDDKVDICKKHGIDGIYFESFDDDFRKMPAEDFVEKVIKHNLKAAYVIVGSNFHFGFRGAGSAFDLESEDYQLFVMPELEISGKTVSSTCIRAFAESGDVSSAARFLGYNYFLRGSIVHGRGVGRTFGVCTANVELSDNFIVPGNGVYATAVSFDGKTYKSVTNIGTKPTFDETERTIEVHIPDFCADLYGKKVRLEFVGRIRGEIKFSSQEELAKQIAEDVKSADAVLEGGCVL